MSNLRNSRNILLQAAQCQDPPAGRHPYEDDVFRRHEGLAVGNRNSGVRVKEYVRSRGDGRVKAGV